MKWQPGKVLIIINNLGIGGAERLVVDDINEMLRREIDVSLVTLRPEPSRNFVAELRLGQDRLFLIHFRSLSDIFALVKLVKLMVSLKPDLVVTQLWFANTVGRVAGFFAGVRRIISFEQNVYDEIKTRKMFFIDWVLQFFSTQIIAVSEAVKKSLIKHSIQEKRIDVLPNSVDLSKFELASPSSEIREEYNIPEKAFLYLFIGRLIHQKAVDILIEAFARVDSGTYLLIVGQGIDRESLEQKIKDFQLEKQVILAGVRDDIPKLFASANCFILPSRHEGLPLVLTEALAAGVAIIVSDFEAAQEIITNKVNGLIVPREDVEALAQAMGLIKDDVALRARLAVAARKSVERFSIVHHVEVILSYLTRKDL